MEQLSEKSGFRTLTSAELGIVSGGSDETEIVVTASPDDAGGGWSIGFGARGGFGEITVTNVDVFLGIGIGTPGFNLDYEDTADLQDGFELDTTNATVQIGVIDAGTQIIDSVIALKHVLDVIPEGFVENYYPNEFPSE